MQTVLKPIPFVLLFLIMSCNSSKSTTKKTVAEYQKEGYTIGTIVPKDSGNCGWVISDSENVKYDPTNIKEEKFSRFSTKEMKIYFKFLPLKQRNRCEDTSPIVLTDVIEYNVK